jgi:3-oxoacyl-[acyl-carrier protein] reductase
MKLDLSNKVAIVTGGARDIGRCVSIRLAECGARVVIAHRAQSVAAANDTVGVIEKSGGTAIALACDVTKEREVDAMVAAARQAFGPKLDVLVNLAGGLVARKKLESMDTQFWEQVLSLNLTSAFLVTKAVLPYLAEGGAIVNFSSQAGRDGGGPGAVAYATAKGALMTFTRGLAKELGPRQIRVNAVCPGLINTTFHNTLTSPEARQKVAGATPLGREGEACEVADLVAYLVSDKASFVNGACIDINGGLYFS